MTHRELLDLAAKAAGLQFDDGRQLNPRKYLVREPGGEWFGWNPLTDDGDALRLAVALGLRVRVCEDLGVVFCTSDDVPAHQASEGFGYHRYAATRRAIVRAAAEIGRSIPAHGNMCGKSTG